MVRRRPRPELSPMRPIAKSSARSSSARSASTNGSASTASRRATEHGCGEGAMSRRTRQSRRLSRSRWSAAPSAAVAQSAPPVANAAVRLLCDDALLVARLLRPRRRGDVVAGVRGRLRRRLCRPRPVAGQSTTAESRGLPGRGRLARRSRRRARASTRTTASPLRIPQARNLHGLERARLFRHRAQRAPTDRHSPDAAGPAPAAAPFAAATSSRPSSPRTPICVPTTWRSPAATASSSTSASASPRTSRPTRSAARSRGTAASATRSRSRRCAEPPGRTRRLGGWFRLPHRGRFR